MSRKKLLLQLYLTPGVGNIAIAKMIHALTDVEAADITPSELAVLADFPCATTFEKNWRDQEAHPERLAQIEALPHFTLLDDVYPRALKEAYRPPCLLFYQGRLDLLQTSLLGVVGTRTPFPYARRIVEHLTTDLLSHFTIVSGLAVGIDTYAHETALQNQGQTIACLGTGLDIFYPRQNQALQKLIGVHGLLLSEYLPGAGPLRHHFPLRNRIIAGLTQGTVVVAAKKRSGSLITALMALDNNREVFAVPGSILEENFIGCHELIQQGAKCVTKSADIIEEFNFF